eukprot:scaffold6875_cov17-Prasinocladus_malaysianus.AAC.1
MGQSTRLYGVICAQVYVKRTDYVASVFAFAPQVIMTELFSRLVAVVIVDSMQTYANASITRNG